MCGAVRYTFSEAPPDYGFCHCDLCQKASGSAFTANIPIARSDITIEGEASIREYESSEGKLRCFCSNCGSPLYAYLRSSPDILRIRLGSLDTAFDQPPACHFFTGDQAPWFKGSQSAPSFEAWPDKAVLVLRGSKHAET
jgi:hypothetical protein